MAWVEVGGRVVAECVGGGRGREDALYVTGVYNGSVVRTIRVSMTDRCNETERYALREVCYRPPPLRFPTLSKH